MSQIAAFILETHGLNLECSSLMGHVFYRVVEDDLTPHTEWMSLSDVEYFIVASGFIDLYVRNRLEGIS